MLNLSLSSLISLGSLPRVTTSGKLSRLGGFILIYFIEHVFIPNVSKLFIDGYGIMVYMIKNLMSFIRKTNPSTSAAVINPVALEGAKRLKEAQQGLAQARKDYANHAFSGHPEEMLETIEDFERVVNRLTKAKKRGWTPSEGVIKEAEHDIEMQTQFMIAHNYSQAEIDSELDWRSKVLEEARQGLR